MLSVPCATSPQNTVEDVFGDDLAPADYGQRWVMYERDAAAQVYRPLALNDPLVVAQGTGSRPWIRASR